MRQPPKVGQVLYSLNVGDACRYGKAQVLTPTKVTKVGRKYFTCNHTDYEGFGSQYRLENWAQVVEYGSPNSELYASEREYEDSVEAKNICRQIADAFEHGYNRKEISTNNLRLLRQILESSNPSMKILSETGPEVLAYMNSLKVDDEVVETSHSCMYGKKGVVYLSESGGTTCVKWHLGDGKWMGTSVTWGTRKISDVK